eukprot:s6676_g3.t1
MYLHQCHSSLGHMLCGYHPERVPDRRDSGPLLTAQRLRRGTSTWCLGPRSYNMQKQDGSYEEALGRGCTDFEFVNV